MKQWPIAYFYQTDIERDVAMSLNPDGDNVDMNSNYNSADFIGHEIDVIDVSISGKYSGKADTVREQFRKVGKPIRTLLLDMYDAGEVLAV